MLGLPPGVEGERVQGQDVVPLMRHVLKIKSDDCPIRCQYSSHVICIYLILLLCLCQGEQLDGGGDGEGVGGLDREPALGPGGVCLAGGGEHQVTVLYQVLCHNSLHRHALKREKKSIKSKRIIYFLLLLTKIRFKSLFFSLSGHDLLFGG